MKKGDGLQNYVPEPNSGCFLWLGAVQPNGYSRVRVGRAMRFAHRVAYEAARGPIAHGLTVDHLCRVKSCVNPSHMELVTLTENGSRGARVRRPAPRKTHCVHGHALSGDNLITHRDGSRACRECARRAWREFARRKRAR